MLWASRLYVLRISSGLCPLTSVILIRFAPRFTTLVTKPARREWPPKVDGSKPRRAAPCFTIAATFRGARRLMKLYWSAVMCFTEEPSRQYGHVVVLILKRLGPGRGSNTIFMADGRTAALFRLGEPDQDSHPATD